MDMATNQVIKIVQVNLRRSAQAWQELLNYFVHSEAQVALISEPYVGANSFVKNVRGLSIYQYPKHDRPVKACIMIKPPMAGHCVGLAQLSTSNLVVVEANLGTEKFEIVSVYIEPKEDPFNTLHSLELYLQTRPGNCLIGGDFNAHHPDWGLVGCTTNGRGDDLLAMIAAHDLDIANLGKEPTYQTVRDDTIIRSIIDLTLVTEDMTFRINNWAVNDTVCVSSDHNLIEFNIVAPPPCSFRPRDSTFKFRTKETDWTHFSAVLTRLLDDADLYRLLADPLAPLEIENAAQLFTAAVQDACCKTMKTTSNKSKIINPWWTPGLDRLKNHVIKLKRNLSHQARTTGVDPDAVLGLKYAREGYKRAIRAASTKHFREFCESQTSCDVWSITNKIIRPPTLRMLASTLHKDGVFADSQIDSLNMMLDKFYPSELPDTLYHHRLIRETLHTKYNCNDNEAPFTTHEVLSALAGMHPNKSPGIDHITAEIWQHVAKCHAPLLLNLYNQCLMTGYFPKCWKKAYIRPIPKPGKEDSTDISSFRPIGLLAIAGKVLEKLFVSRLVHHLDVNNSLSPFQFGFRAQSSTVHALQALTDVIKDRKKKGHQVALLSLDIQAAFDNAPWSHILYRLRQLNCPQNLYHLMKDYLHSWKVILRQNGVTVEKDLQKGCIQGSICGPIFWNILLDDLLSRQFLPKQVHLQAYADDVVMVVSAPTALEVKKLSDTMLTSIMSWGENNKLNFNPMKTIFVPFTKRLKTFTINLGNQVIAASQEVKILGVIIDSKLNFGPHVNYAVGKASRLFRKLCQFVRPTWGIHSDNIKIIYKQVITPILLYAVEIWGKAVGKLVHRRLLHSLQRSISIRCIRGFHTISFAAATVVAGLPPLHLEVARKNREYNIKRKGVIAIDDNTVAVTQTPTQTRTLTLETKIKPGDRPHPALRPLITIHKVTTPAQNTKHLSEINIYTDGSKLEDERTGAALLIQTQSHEISNKFKLHPTCSVFQAELFSISQALNWLHSHPQPGNATIFSDSMSALQAMQRFTTFHPIINQIQTLTHNILQFRQLKFCWIKAHVGLEGNERADTLAKEAAEDAANGPWDYSATPISHGKRLLGLTLLKEWQQEYELSITGRRTYALLPNVATPAKFTSDTNFSFTQYLTGHSYTLQYLHRFNITSTEECPCGFPSQTFEHLLIQCPRFCKLARGYPEIVGALEQAPHLRQMDSLTKREITQLRELVGAVVRALKTYNDT